MARKITKKIKIGSRFIGGGEPILVQSMLLKRVMELVVCGNGLRMQAKEDRF